MIARTLQHMINFFRLVAIACTTLMGGIRVLLITWGISNHTSPRCAINKQIRKHAVRIMQLAGSNARLIVNNDFKLKANEPYIYISNHISLLDPPLIYSLLPGTIRLVAKQSLFDIPIFGRALKHAGMISIEKKDLFEHLKSLMCDGISIWVFAEGHRSKDGSLLAFKAGAFSLARQVGAKIIPAAIMGTNRLLAANSLRLGYGSDTEIRLGHPIDSLLYAKPEQQPALIREAWNAVNNLMKSSTGSNI